MVCGGLPWFGVVCGISTVRVKGVKIFECYLQILIPVN